MMRAIIASVSAALSLCIACNGRVVPQEDPPAAPKALGGDRAAASDTDAGAATGVDATAASPCVFPAPSNSFFAPDGGGQQCPDGCNTSPGTQLDKDANGACTRQLLVGCCAPNTPCHGWTFTVCLVNVADGRIVSVWDGTPLSSHEWRACSHDEYQSLQVRSCQ